MRNAIQEVNEYPHVYRNPNCACNDLQLARQAHADAEALPSCTAAVTQVYRYHMAHTGNVKDAEDLTSQTFMAALEGIRSFRGSGSFAAWVMGIATRKRALFFRGSKPEVPLDAALHIPTPGLPTDKAAAQRLRMENIRNALRQLSPERAEALILYYFGGLNTAETGRVLGKSQAAVKMLLSRRLARLTRAHLPLVGGGK
jgi:RNA polymerase sigma-70 factor (ECF subfamily)